jgi:hypothetical protein
MSRQGSHSACLTGDFAFKQRFADPDGALGRGLGGVMHACLVRWISSAKIGSRLAPYFALHPARFWWFSWDKDRPAPSSPHASGRGRVV